MSKGVSKKTSVFHPCLRSRRFCRKTTLTKHAKKHPVEHNCAIDDDGDDSADDDWDSDPEDSAHEPCYSAPQAPSRPTSCFGNHWPLPAETVQQTKGFGRPPHRLDTSLGGVKLERSSSGSPLGRSMADVSDPIAACSYMPTSNGISRKPPPVRTQTLQEYRSVPMSHQYPNENGMETFQSPTSLGSPDGYAPFPSQPGNIHSSSMYLHQPRYNSYPHPPRVHDILLDDPLHISQPPSTDVSPSMSQFPNSAESLSAQDGRFAMDVTTSEEGLQGYLSPIAGTQAQFQEPHTNMIDSLRFQMPVNNYPCTYGPAPEWYTNIKPEETWPGDDPLPEARLQGFS